MLERLAATKHAMAASEKEASVPLKHALRLESFPLLLCPASQVFLSQMSVRVSLAQQHSDRPQLPSGPTSVRMSGPFVSLAFTSLPVSVCQVAAPEHEDCVWVFCMGLRFSE